MCRPRSARVGRAIRRDLENSRGVELLPKSSVFLVTIHALIVGSIGVRVIMRRAAREGGPPIRLESITTISEAVDKELREMTAQHLQTRLFDLYSSQEAGSMAIQCPDYETYHAHSEVMILEVLNERGEACAPGEFGRVDFTTRKFVPLCFLPGYVRGLTFLNDRLAIVGLSQPRDQHAFRGLPLDGELQRRKISPRSGFYVIDVTTGDILHYGLIEGHHVELYDVVTLPDVRAARAVPLSGDEQRQTISIE